MLPGERKGQVDKSGHGDTLDLGGPHITKQRIVGERRQRRLDLEINPFARHRPQPRSGRGEGGGGGGPKRTSPGSDSGATGGTVPR